MQLPEHGANPFKLYKKLGVIPPNRVLDFSENVNPAGPPRSVQKIWADLFNKINQYPDPDGEPFLTAAVNFHKIDRESLIIGNGAAELLSLMAERYRGKKAIVVHPTFSEYETTLKAKNVEIVRVLSAAENGFKLPMNEIQKAMENAQVLYLCTPNNPTGILPERKELIKLVRYGAKVNCEIVFDEAFIDFIDESLSFISEIKEFPHVIVVRSMTKMYAIPGIRLGYVVASPTVISEIKAHAPHWNVNGIAAQVGALCLDVAEYREKSILQSNEQRRNLKAFLETNDCTVTDSVVNYLSFKPGGDRTSRQLHADLLQRGIVLRHSENFYGMDGEWLRVGMKNAEEMAVLQEELAKWFAEN
ncbi:threonine-phosphate decarboxylase CobD [Sporosarcina jiandibaonis]|uniref:threonine-phosphate decarboxylase CobD n=1 Tax=Sporosarcina jiandibaonis TaxID=2715535 RepID=UPI001552F1CA|nr:threonine-phosphate decarboxylase CobD [Sporosarcina jiandibaonis]